MNRVQGKDGRRQERPGHLEQPQYSEEQQRTTAVQQNVDQVIPQRRIPPEPVLGPEAAEGQGVVLLRGPWFKPDAGQASQRTEFRPGDVRVVVPDRLSEPGRPVSDERGRNQKQTSQPLPMAPTGRVQSRRGNSSHSGQTARLRRYVPLHRSQFYWRPPANSNANLTRADHFPSRLEEPLLAADLAIDFLPDSGLHLRTGLA